MNRFCLKFLLAVFCLWAPAAVCRLPFAATTAVAAEVAEGKLAAVKGAVEVKKRGGEEWIDAYNDMRITPGDIISTGIDGRAKLLFKNSETKIEPLTQFVLGRSVEKDTEMYTELFLLAGKVSSHVLKTKYTGIKNKFNVVTPTAVVGVRGTIETVEYNPGMGTKAEIKDGKGYAAPLPADRLPPAVLELLGIAPTDTKPAGDTGMTQSSGKKEGRSK